MIFAFSRNWWIFGFSHTLCCQSINICNISRSTGLVVIIFLLTQVQCMNQINPQNYRKYLTVSFYTIQLSVPGTSSHLYLTQFMRKSCMVHIYQVRVLLQYVHQFCCTLNLLVSSNTRYINCGLIAGPKHRQRFLCEVRVAGYNYMGVGNSTSKKDAQTNAAKDFVQFLIRQGEVTPSDVPDLNVSL